MTRPFLLLFIVQMCCAALGEGQSTQVEAAPSPLSPLESGATGASRPPQAQSANMLGKWNIEITFGDRTKHSLRFDAQGDGKGSLLLLDPIAKAWGADKASTANWTLSEGNSVTFSGPMEFLLGNVGRDAGRLKFTGKFETPDLITGEVEFSPLVGDQPSKHGTFKALRAGG